MITQTDIEVCSMPAEVIDYCKEHPVANCKLPVTGQLKAIGDRVIQQIAGMDDQAFAMQLESARDMGVSCVCEDQNQKPIGLSATVSLIKDNDVFDKKIVMPAGQIRKHQYLDAHHAVAVYVVGTKNPDNTLGNVESIYAAGWLPVFKMKRWIQKGGSAPFQVNKMSLAVAPVQVLNPLGSLREMVRWHHICV